MENYYRALTLANQEVSIALVPSTKSPNWILGLSPKICVKHKLMILTVSKKLMLCYR